MVSDSQGLFRARMPGSKDGTQYAWSRVPRSCYAVMELMYLLQGQNYHSSPFLHVGQVLHVELIYKEQMHSQGTKIEPNFPKAAIVYVWFVCLVVLVRGEWID